MSEITTNTKFIAIFTLIVVMYIYISSSMNAEIGQIKTEIDSLHELKREIMKQNVKIQEIETPTAETTAAATSTEVKED